MPPQPKGERIACERCGKDRYVHPYMVGKARFCSRKCSRNGPSRSGTMRDCKTCGKSFYVPPSSTRSYCSQGCAHKAPRPSKGTYRYDHKKAIELYEQGLSQTQVADIVRSSNGAICRMLKAEGIKARPFGTHNKGRKYPKERREKISRTRIKLFEQGILDLSGANNPAYIDGTYTGGCRYGGGWERKRREALERDGHRCTECGADEVRLDVHHVVPYRICKEHRLENLTTLCITCHGRISGNAKKITLREASRDLRVTV